MDPFADPHTDAPEEAAKPAPRGKKPGPKKAGGELANMGETAPLEPIRLKNMGETGGEDVDTIDDRELDRKRKLANMGETGAEDVEPMREPPKIRLKNMGETGAIEAPSKLKNMGETGAIEAPPKLRHMGETGAIEAPSKLKNMGETGAIESPPKLRHMGETGAIPELEDMGETGAMEAIRGDGQDLRPKIAPRVREPKLRHMGETGAIEGVEAHDRAADPFADDGGLENMGETGALPALDRDGLENMGETSELRPIRIKSGDTGAIARPGELPASNPLARPRELRNMGETGGIADPFADGGPRLADGHDETQDGFDATRDEAAPSDSSRGPLRRGDNEENVIAVVGDEPEPDSQPGYAAAEETGPAGDSAPTVDLPQTDLESLRTPSFVKDVEEGGGSEGLTMNKGRDLAGGPAHDDLRDVDAAPPLDADEARAREEETGDPDATGPEGDSQADTATVEDEQEPDFLYGERFSDKFQVPEGPPPKPSRAPQIIAAVAGVILLGAAVAVVGKYASQREFVPGTDIPTVRPVVAPPEPKRDPGATSRPQPLRPTNPGESTPEPRPAVVTPPPKPADVPPPLPSPTDAIGVKIRRALSWGLPIEPPKDAAAQPPKPQGGDR